jgi:diguanylate cyclase (GGDEF)-like protein/PAS domain S-box-containing protein
MASVPDRSDEIEAGAGIAVAVIARDADGALMLNACNDAFLVMMGAARAERFRLPYRFDEVVADQALRNLGERLLTYFESSNKKERTYEHRDGARMWRITLQWVRRDEWVLTGLETSPKADLTHELQVSASRFQAVVDSAYDAIVSIDVHHNITLFNRAAENLFGYPAAEVLGRPIETLLPERYRANHGRNVRQFAASPQTSLRAMAVPRMDETNSVFGRHRDGTIIPVEIAISKIQVDGLVEFTAVVRDITERAQLLELLRKQAVTDALTGLPNRREFLDFLERALASDDGFSVFILDIDAFKKINDTYGHDIGDEVLRVLANAGLSIPHESTLFARWGGEEFVAALPGADAVLARRIAEAFRLRFERQDVDHTWRVKPIPFTVSIGVVTREPGERDVDALMRRADRALYQAKEAGRNRVVVG